MRIQKIRNIHNTKQPIFKPNHIKFTMNIIPKNSHTEADTKNRMSQNSRKFNKKRLKFAPKIALNPDYYWNENGSQTCHKSVTKQSQMCHKSVTNQSQIRHKKAGNLQNL